MKVSCDLSHDAAGHSCICTVVGEPVMPKEDAPDTLWFLVIFVLFGLFLIAFGFLIATLISRKCHQVYSSGRYSCKHNHTFWPADFIMQF